MTVSQFRYTSRRVLSDSEPSHEACEERALPDEQQPSRVGAHNVPSMARSGWLCLLVGLLLGACTTPRQTSAQPPSPTVYPPSSSSPQGSPTGTPAALCPPSCGITLRPDHGPVGTRVQVSGPAPSWAVPDDIYALDLERTLDPPGDCDAIAATSHRFSVDANGNLTGWFIVPATASCFQQLPPGSSRTVGPGTWDVGLGCHSCQIATFRVTGRSTETCS